jgi:nitroreductase
MTDTVPTGADAPVFEVMRTMRAMRRLKPDPVPRELLVQLVEAATWAPSGGNDQGFDFVVVDDRETIARMAPLWQRIHDLYTSPQGELPPNMDPAQGERTRAALRFQSEHFAETPAVIVACYKPRALGGQIRRNWRTLCEELAGFGPVGAAKVLRHAPGAALRSQAASIYPGVQNLLLAARALGLGANITTWHMFLEHEWKRELGIPRDVHTYAVIPIGWPKGRFGPVTRRPAAEAIHWNRW